MRQSTSTKARIRSNRGWSKRFSKPLQLASRDFLVRDSCSSRKIDNFFSASSACSCIKWVQESFPTGGECSGLVVLYEQCVRTLWHDERYKDDLRFLKVWLEYVSRAMPA